MVIINWHSNDLDDFTRPVSSPIVVRLQVVIIVSCPMSQNEKAIFKARWLVCFGLQTSHQLMQVIEVFNFFYRHIVKQAFLNEYEEAARDNVDLFQQRKLILCSHHQMDTKIVQFLSSLRFTNKKIEDDATGPPKNWSTNRKWDLCTRLHSSWKRSLVQRKKSYRPRGHCVFKQSLFFVIVHLNWCYIILS